MRKIPSTTSNADEGFARVEVAGTPRAPAPGRVTGVTVTPEVQRLSVSWNAVADADGYKVQWRLGSQDFGADRQRTVTGGNTTSHVITGLTAGTEYRVRVTAVRSNADDGQPSSEILATPKATTPGQVTGVSVTPGVLRLSVSWNAVTDAAGYKVQWKSGSQDFGADRQRTVTGGNTTSHVITGLTAGTEYRVRATAVRSNADDGQPSLEIPGTPMAPAPGQVTGVSITPGVLILSVSWNSLMDADGYKVQWRSGNQEFHSTREDPVTGGNTTSHVITGLSAGTEYTVRVIATRLNADDSPAEIEVTGIPKAQPPGQVTGGGVTPGVLRLSVSWNAVTDADGYKVQWKSGSQDFGADRQRTVTGGNTTSHVITGLTAGTEYRVRVTAVRSHADDGQPSLEIPGTPRAPAPGQVAGVSVTPGVLRLSVSWNAVTDADGYKVQWKSGAQQFNETDRQRTVTGGNTTSHVITGLTADTEYTVRVIAFRSLADDGQPSLPDTGTPRAQPPPPPPPSIPPVPVAGQVAGVSVTPGVLILSVSWNAVTDADGYKVQWRSDNQEFDSTREDTVTGGNTTSHVITGLSAGTEYTVRVIATRLDADDGQPSSEVKGIPEASDQVVPVDPVTGGSGGGCAIIPEEAVGNISVRTFFNLLLIVSLMLFAGQKSEF